MAVSASTLAFVCELLAGLGDVKSRRMFGCAGLYFDEVMFGLVDDDRIFLKVDDALKADLAAAGSQLWVYTKMTKPKVPTAPEAKYWSLPEAALDDPDAACDWARRALAAARAAKPVKRSR